MEYSNLTLSVCVVGRPNDQFFAISRKGCMLRQIWGFPFPDGLDPLVFSLRGFDAGRGLTAWEIFRQKSDRSMFTHAIR
jgi:hypothetical protein